MAVRSMSTTQSISRSLTRISRTTQLNIVAVQCISIMVQCLNVLAVCLTAIQLMDMAVLYLHKIADHQQVSVHFNV